jgi:hypothetical protein
LESFFDLMDYYGDTTYRPLSEQPAQLEIQRAHDFQLNEFGRRSPAHANIVFFERQRRATAMSDPSVEDIKLLCMKALLIDPPNGDTVGDGTDIVTMEKFGNMLDWFGPLVNPRSRKVILLDTLIEILSEPYVIFLDFFLDFSVFNFFLSLGGFMEKLVKWKQRIDWREDLWVYF